MTHDFDRVIDRRGTNSAKWKHYGADVLPLWVADMDFPAPEPVQEALRRAVEHGIFGYEFPTKELRETVAVRMDTLYGWQVSPEMVVATPGVIAGFNAAARTVCTAGQGILVQPPVYPPFLSVHKNAALVRQDAPLRMTTEGANLRYGVDFDVFERAVNSGDAQTGMFLLCNPHNPTGKVFSRQDLLRMAEVCLKNDTVICSDEIHSELCLGGAQHIPLAILSSEIADQTITLVAPSKTFNVAGLYCAFAIIPNPDLLRRYKKTTEQMSMHLSSLGLAAAQSAFSGACDDWLAALRVYLTGNRDFLVEYVKREFSGIRITVPEATYLTWLDCNELVRSGRIHGTPHEFFLKQAKVALNEGKEFGSGGEGFVRLNFGCPRKTLEDALERMKTALA
ncbi:MAG: PatB family C-S lyase [Chloroflexi bacterium]|nr:PatB family C-S lyase [Chloroflexota bacterium]